MAQTVERLTNSVREILFRDQKTTLITTASIAAVSLASVFLFKAFTRENRYHAWIKFLAAHTRARISGVSREEQLLRHIVEKAKEGDPESVLKAVDDFCYSTSLMMHVGDVKGRILDELVSRHKPKVAVEFGAYCGYSAVRTGRLLPPGGHLFSIEFNPLFAAIATKVVEFAGLSDRVTVVIGSAESQLPLLRTKHNVFHIDMLFIDHWKDLYLPDLRRVEEQGYLRKGSVVIADNILFPGAPEYAAYVRNSPRYSSEFFESTLEYTASVKDGIEVSVVQN